MKSLSYTIVVIILLISATSAQSATTYILSEPLPDSANTPEGLLAAINRVEQGAWTVCGDHRAFGEITSLNGEFYQKDERFEIEDRKIILYRNGAYRAIYISGDNGMEWLQDRARQRVSASSQSERYVAKNADNGDVTNATDNGDVTRAVVAAVSVMGVSGDDANKVLAKNPEILSNPSLIKRFIISIDRLLGSGSSGTDALAEASRQTRHTYRAPIQWDAVNAEWSTKGVTGPPVSLLEQDSNN